jgi:UDP-arabinose 4-epimerase
MNILVTGGAGYIGSHTAKVLARAGHQPVVLDNLSTGHASNVRWGPLVRADLTDTSVLREVLRSREIEAVIHFAASALVGESVVQPLAYFQNNIGGTLSLLEAMNSTGVTRLVFSSSCASYGVPKQIPIPEDHSQEPVNPYGESKLAAEKMFKWMGQAGQLRWVALRYFNAAGADPDGDLGEEHDPETHLIPLAIAAALGQRRHLELFGFDYPTPDGTAVRDYIHVIDLALGHLRALEYLGAGGESLAVNLGTGNGTSVRDVISMVEKVAGRAVPRRECPRRAGDPPALVASNKLARRVLGWEPSCSHLETIVETAWRWHSRHGSKSSRPRRGPVGKTESAVGEATKALQ